MKYLTEESIENIATGAAVLGTGGGGDPYIGKLLAKEAIKKYGPVKVITMDELDDEALVVPVSGMGAPTVTIEKLSTEEEIIKPVNKLEEILGKKVDVIIPIEIGGTNSLVPVVAAAKKGVPILDADAIGRAFPEAQMVTFYLEGYDSSPVTIADEKGNCAVIYPINGIWSERLARALTVEMGGKMTICDYSLSGEQVKKAAIKGTLTLAEEIGSILNLMKDSKEGIDSMIDKLDGFKLFEAKVIDIKRKLSGGFTKGFVEFKGINNDESKYSILFQNEYLIAKKNKKTICTTPDLISILDYETGKAVTTDKLKYGMRVICVSFPCNDKWRTKKGIETAGPKYFGYEEEYVPVEKLYNKFIEEE